MVFLKCIYGFLPISTFYSRTGNSSQLPEVTNLVSECLDRGFCFCECKSSSCRLYGQTEFGAKSMPTLSGVGIRCAGNEAVFRPIVPKMHRIVKHEPVGRWGPPREDFSRSDLPGRPVLIPSQWDATQKGRAMVADRECPGGVTAGN